MKQSRTEGHLILLSMYIIYAINGELTLIQSVMFWIGVITILITYIPTKK